MRYILLKRRRQGVIFIFLLLAVLVSTLVVMWPYILDDFKLYARKEIARNFNVEVEVGEIRGGLISPLTFENLRVTKKKGAEDFISFRAKTSLEHYRIWDLLLARIYGYRQLALVFSDGELYVTSQQPLLCKIDGRLEIDENQTASVNLIANHNSDKILLSGKIKIKKGFESPDMNLKVSYIKQPARLDALRVNFFDYLQIAQADIFLVGQLEKLEAKGSLFLHGLERIDFRTNLSIAEEEIRIENGEINDDYTVEGMYNIKENKLSGQFSYLENKEKYLAMDLSLPSVSPSLVETGQSETDGLANKSVSDEKIVLEQVGETKETNAGKLGLARNPQEFALNLKFNHFKLFGTDIMSFVEIQGVLFAGDREVNVTSSVTDRVFNDTGLEKISFKLLTYGTIIDSRPASELGISCNYEDGILNIGSIQLGDEHFTYGTVDFRRQPPELKLTWQVTNMDLNELLVLSDEKSANARLSGKLDGKMQLEGSLFNPFVKISLKSKQGNFLNMAFASANVNLEGNYPVLAFHDSRIYREEGGFFIIDGKIDLRNIHTIGLFDNVKILSDEKTIVMDGWDISRGAEQCEVNLKKAVSEDLRVGFKAFINNQPQTLSDEANSLELEYKLQENRALLMRFEKEGEFLGVKQGAKF